MVEVYTFTPPDFQRVARCQSHKFGVQHIEFSPDADVLVTVGDGNDKSVAVWNTANWSLRSTDKSNKQIHGLAFGQEYFITCGQGFVRKHRYRTDETPVPYELSEMAKKTFVGVGVAPSNQTLFGITSDAILCSFNDQLIHKWVDL
ncbi:MAG: hypothetical protein V2I33_19210 [Kangiellaceae bacterium]|nr:hypothetical protein [Kangiellaceae bacterium]